MGAWLNVAFNTHPSFNTVYSRTCIVQQCCTCTTASSCISKNPSGCAQVDLIMMGERYRQLLDCGVDPWQQAQAERDASSFADVVSLPE